MIFGSHFIFDGIDSREFDVITCSFDGNQDESLPMGLGIEPITTELSDRIIDYGGKYNEVITFDFSITHSCGRMGEPFDRREIRDITNWLSSKELKWLSFFDEDETEYWYFCRFTDIETKKIGGKTVGFNLEVTCDSPFAYSEIKTVKLWETTIEKPSSDNVVSVGSHTMDDIKIISDTDEPTCPNLFIEHHGFKKLNKQINVLIYNNDSNAQNSCALELTNFPIDDTSDGNADNSCVMVDPSNWVMCNYKKDSGNFIPNYSVAYGGTRMRNLNINIGTKPMEIYNGANHFKIYLFVNHGVTSSDDTTGCTMTFHMQYREKYRIGVF